jgi:DNA modification methylase
MAAVARMKAGMRKIVHDAGAHAGCINAQPAANGKRNMRNWWLLGPEPFAQAHFATFPTEIPRRAILAGSKPGDTVLDPFLGSGTTALVADQLQRNCIGIEINPAYAKMAETRINAASPLFCQVSSSQQNQQLSAED